MRNVSDKPCSRCNTNLCQKGYRFCSNCKNDIEREMAKSKYLTPVSMRNNYRGPGAREIKADTRRGTDS